MYIVSEIKIRSIIQDRVDIFYFLTMLYKNFGY